MATIKEIREYKNTEEFQAFLEKFCQDTEFQSILKTTNIIFKDDDSMHSDNMLSEDLQLSSATLNDIKHHIQYNSKLF